MWARICHSTFKPVWMSTPGGSDGKESACNVGDWGVIPGHGRAPGGGNGNPVQCSCLESPTDRGAWRITVYRVTKSRTRLSDLHCLTCSQILTNKLCDLVSKSTCLALSFHIYKTAPVRGGSVHPEGDQSWEFIGGTDAEAETPVLWPPDAKSWLTGKDPDAGKDWRREEKGTTEDETEDEMVGWNHRLNGREFE